MKNKIVNVKFKTDDERRLHSHFKAQCALHGADMQSKIIQLIRDYIYNIEGK